MLNIQSLIAVIEVILVVVPALLTVAFVTIAERKTMASMQRRLGPNIVGYYGLLQAFADALKLLLKEYVGPTQANLILFFLGPIITLIFSLLGYAVIPYGPGLTIADLNLGILYLLVVSSFFVFVFVIVFLTLNAFVIFVFFFIAKYASIVLICIFTTLLFLCFYMIMFLLDFLVNGFFFFKIINIDFFKNIYTKTNVDFI